MSDVYQCTDPCDECDRRAAQIDATGTPLSPIFECSLDGLRSAVTLRNRLRGVPSPEEAARRYMRGYGISDASAGDRAVLRDRIGMVIRDIEHLSVCPGDGSGDGSGGSGCGDGAHGFVLHRLHPNTRK